MAAGLRKGTGNRRAFRAVAAGAALILWSVAPPSAPAKDSSQSIGEKLHGALPRTQQTARIRRTEDPIQIDGQQFVSMLGMSISELRLYRFRNDRPEAIPYQIDERNTEGLWVLPSGKNPDCDDQSDRFDKNDALVFLARDLGDKVALSGSGIGPRTFGSMEEIEVRDPLDGQKGWAYLFHFPSPPDRSSLDYVSFDPRTNRVRTHHYGFGYTETLPTFLSLNEGMARGQNLLDRMKMRTRMRLLFGFISIERDEDDLQTELVAYKDGPVRVIRRLKNRIRIGLGIASPSFTIEHMFYPSSIELPFEFTIPFSPSRFLADVEARGGLDFHSLKGWRFRTDRDPKTVSLDGKMSPEEVALNGQEFDWFVLIGPNGAYLTRMIMGDSLRPLERTLYYVDDDTSADPPESFPGESPNIQYVLNGWDKIEKGNHRLRAITYRLPSYRDGAEEEVLRIEDHPLIAIVGSRIGLSAARTPSRDPYP